MYCTCMHALELGWHIIQLLLYQSWIKIAICNYFFVTPIY